MGPGRGGSTAPTGGEPPAHGRGSSQTQARGRGTKTEGAGAAAAEGADAPEAAAARSPSKAAATAAAAAACTDEGIILDLRRSHMLNIMLAIWFINNVCICLCMLLIV